MIIAPASPGGVGVGVKDEQALYTKRSWEEKGTRKPSLPGLCSLCDGKPGPHQAPHPHTSTWCQCPRFLLPCTNSIAPAKVYIRDSLGTVRLRGGLWSPHTNLFHNKTKSRAAETRKKVIQKIPTFPILLSSPYLRAKKIRQQKQLPSYSDPMVKA